MRNTYNFSIDSEPSGHKLFLNGQEIGRFTTLDAAEAEANRIANHAIPGAKLRFELDFKSTLADLEVRAATLELESRRTILH